jgi:hypothetical protein
MNVRDIIEHVTSLCKEKWAHDERNLLLALNADKEHYVTIIRKYTPDIKLVFM